MKTKEDKNAEIIVEAAIFKSNAKYFKLNLWFDVDDEVGTWRL